MLEQIDHNSVLFLNSFFGDDSLWDKIIVNIGQNAFVRGFPIFFPLVALWFYGDNLKRRARISAGLFATFLAVSLSVFLQYHVYIHTRPILDETLHLKIFEPTTAVGWDRSSSFPSDTATLYFSLCAVIFMEMPLVGSIALLWSLLTVGIMRVLVGFHYPSDILGSLVLGPGFVFLIARTRYVAISFEHLLKKFQSTEYLVHAVFFIVLAEAYNLFLGLQNISKGLWMVARRLTGLF